jgi:hypothetical protein
MKHWPSGFTKDPIHIYTPGVVSYCVSLCIYSSPITARCGWISQRFFQGKNRATATYRRQPKRQPGTKGPKAYFRGCPVLLDCGPFAIHWHSCWACKETIAMRHLDQPFQSCSSLLWGFQHRPEKSNVIRLPWSHMALLWPCFMLCLIGRVPYPWRLRVGIVLHSSSRLPSVGYVNSAAR